MRNFDAEVERLTAERDELKARASRIFDAHLAALAERDRLQADLARANARAEAWKKAANSAEGFMLGSSSDDASYLRYLAAARRLEGE